MFYLMLPRPENFAGSTSVFFILNVAAFNVAAGHEHRPPSQAVPYVAAIVGAILAVVCLIAWALN